MGRPAALAYLMLNLNENHDFTLQWKNLSDSDKADLRRWADEEMDALGL